MSPQAIDLPEKSAWAYDENMTGQTIYAYVGGNPISFTDPHGTNPLAGAIEGAEIGTLVWPGVGTVVGGLVGAGVGWWAADKLSNVILNREKDVPNRSPPGEWIDGNNRSRLYGPDGRPVLDIDKPHQGYDKPHVHEWPDGKREHPGRDFCPLSKK